MSEAIQSIEFSIEELQALHQAQNITQVMKISFLYGSDEAFHALCSLVRNAKDMSSNSKRIRREARINFYNGLVETQYPHLSNFHDRSLTYMEFGAACQTFSDRWTTQFLLDELVSLAFIVDKDETGDISLEVFMNFIEDVDEAFHSNPSHPTEALEDMYDRRREKLFRYVMVAFPSLELRTKLASLASVACQLNIQPLCTLIDLLENDIDPQPEDVIGFVIQLTGTVNQGIKDAEAQERRVAEEAAAELVALAAAHRGLPTHSSSGDISPIGSFSPRTDLSVSMNSHQDRHDHHGRLADSFALDHSYSSHSGSAGRSAAVSTESAADIACSSSSSSSSIRGIAQLDSASVNDVLQVEIPTPLNSVDLLQSLNNIQTKTQEIAQSLSAPTSVANNTFGEKDNGDEALETISPAVSATSMSNEALLEQIQLMEAELQRAKQLLSPSAGNTPSTPGLTIESPTTRSTMPPLSSFTPPRPSADHHHSSSAVRRTSISSEGGAPRRRFSITSEASLQLSQASPHSSRTPSASRRPSLSGWASTMKIPEEPQPKLNGTPGKTLCATPGSSARSVGNSSLADRSFGATTTASISKGSGKLLSLSMKRGKTVGSTGKLDRSSPLTKHVDLSIFKSPHSHRRPDARNIFDGEKQTWVPSSTRKLGASPKPDRFSTTFDLMVAREVNPVFFDN